MKIKLRMVYLRLEFIQFINDKEEQSKTKHVTDEEILSLKSDQLFLEFIIKKKYITFLLENDFLDCIHIEMNRELAFYLIKNIVKIIKGYTGIHNHFNIFFNFS